MAISPEAAGRDFGWSAEAELTEALGETFAWAREVREAQA